MRTEVIPATDPKAIRKAVQILESGGLVVFPTDTVYGVGAHAFLPQAVQKIYDVKERPLDRAIPLLIDSAHNLTKLAKNIPYEAWTLAGKFWPGPLTIVLERKAVVPDVVTGGGTTVAIRVPDHPLALRLIRTLGASLAATSANLTGHPDPVTAAEALDYLEGRTELILDGGRCPGGIPSTVIDLTRTPPAVVRLGAVTHADLERAVAGLFGLR